MTRSQRTVASSSSRSVIDDTPETRITVDVRDGVHVVVPHLPRTFSEAESIAAQRAALERLFALERITRYVLWYYTPLALRFTAHLTPAGVAYDCIDALSTFGGAATELSALERELMRRADVVFTSGQSLYEARKGQHPNIHVVPSSVDVAHFAAARQRGAQSTRPATDPAPAARVLRGARRTAGRPAAAGVGRCATRLAAGDDRAGRGVRQAPPAEAADIHYLGPKTYEGAASVHRRLGRRAAAVRPQRGDAVISPTRTAAYLAAGRPVVSTSIRNVISQYGERELVYIADTVSEMVRACNAALREPAEFRRTRADAFLSGMSWDRTWSRTASLLDAAIAPAAPQPPQTARAASGG